MKYKLKAIIPFIDKYTNKEYVVGDQIECEEQRGKELLADERGLVELVEKLENNETKRVNAKKAKE